MKKIITLTLLVLGIISISVYAAPSLTVYAETLGERAQCQGDRTSCVCPTTGARPAGCTDPATTDEPIIDCNDDGKFDKNCNLFTKYVNPLIILLSSMVGVAVVFGIIYGGIQYSASAGDPQKAAKAKNHIRNSIVALLFFFFLYMLLKFLIPGGSLITG
ncbi:MAG TPA: hypothetical protein VF575_04885 [Candidatus Saccharimonadales bacterium]|jgi:hypothetical protein